jgi:peptidoglycan hydrolase-like protein with peptidoglycan-binding domain
LKLQKLLYEKGYDPNGLDSVFGPGCEKAVKQFQRDNGLKDDGVVGPLTWNKLMNG